MRYTTVPIDEDWGFVTSGLQKGDNKDCSPFTFSFDYTPKAYQGYFSSETARHLATAILFPE